MLTTGTTSTGDKCINLPERYYLASLLFCRELILYLPLCLRCVCPANIIIVPKLCLIFAENNRKKPQKTECNTAK